MDNGTDRAAPGAAATLLCFTQDGLGDARRLLEEAGAGSVVALSASDAFGALRRQRSVLIGGDQLGVVGSPPSDGIVYGLAPLVAMLARARQVTLVDTSTRQARRMTATRFIAGSVPTT